MFNSDKFILSMSSWSSTIRNSSNIVDVKILISGYLSDYISWANNFNIKLISCNYMIELY